MLRMSSSQQIMSLSALLLIALLLFIPNSAQAGEEEISASIFLPLVEVGAVEGGNGGNTPTPTVTPTEIPTETPTATTTPPPSNEPVAFFADTEFRTSSADIVTDAQGGKHLGYLYYEPTNDDAPTYGVYLYCPSACENPAQWQGVSLGEIVNEIQLSLTPDGNPRILFRSPGVQNGQDFFYAACDENCTAPEQWQVTQVASNLGMAVVEYSDDDLPQRYFALDHLGRPRFIYGDRNTFVEPDHLGTFYAYCDANCSDAANWFETRINKDNGNVGPYRAEKFSYPSLSFTNTGLPRVAAEGFSMQDESFFYYISCDSACENSESWVSTTVFERGSGVKVSYDLALNSQGQPRVAFYQGAMLEGKGDRLVYGWCNEVCADVANWQGVELGLQVNDGQSPDLELDATDHPHIAYVLHSTGGVGYARCESNCEGDNAQWSYETVESGADLAQAWTLAHPPHCDGGFWDGLTPTLSLDQSGNANVAYDAAYYARCYYNPVTREWETHTYIHLVWRAVRMNIFP